MDSLSPSFYSPTETEELKIHVIAENLLWSDLGSWGAIKTHIPSNGDGNSVVGDDVRLFNCKGCIVHAAFKTVIAEGLEGYIIADSSDRLVICPLNKEQHIKECSAPK
ncbi:MAG: hypothetical protein IJ714_07150 [Bacteroidales bacterium]|nr:hypothetical protein [Prevotella sp.]MBR1699542.1 hypothetical protein [Bacteroidales bacterium]